ncbi:MAG: M56 family metallopeptidase [Candidatus Latescibacterota bacterium]
MIPLESLFAALGHTLWAVSWQVAALAAFIGLLSLFFRKASSSFRYFLWCIVLARLVIPVKLELPALSWSGILSLIIGRFPAFNPEIAVPSIFRELPGTAALSGGPALPPVPVSQSVHNPEILPIFFAVLWLAVVLGAGILMVRSLLRARRLLEACPPVERPELLDLLESARRKMGIAHRIPLRYLDIPGQSEPSVAGIFHPAIYLPPRIADEWETRDIEPILLHELAHIRRHDLPVNLLQAVAQVLYFFHPLVWLANGRMRMLREEVCDDLSIQMLDNRGGRYAASILNFISEPRMQPSWGFSGIGFGEGKGTINKRVRRIMQNDYTPGRRMGVLSVALLLAIGAAGLVLSAEKPVAGRATAAKKTIAALKKAGILENIIITQGPLESERKKAIGKYLSNPDEKNPIPFLIAQGKGTDLQPPKSLGGVTESLAKAVDRYTNLDVKTAAGVPLDSPHLFESPFVYITADKAFELTKTEYENFGKYLRNGGFAFIDNGTPQYEFGKAEASLRAMLRDALGSDAKFAPIPNDHPLYHCYFDFDGPPMGKTGEAETKMFATSRYIEGIWLDERLAVIYFDYGYGYRWIEPEKSEPQVKLGVNFMVYALLQENGMMVIRTPRIDTPPDPGDLTGLTSVNRVSDLNSKKNTIRLNPAQNILEGSEKVTIHGKALTRGTDYTIDYQTGEVTILNEEALDPNAHLEISYEEKVSEKESSSSEQNAAPISKNKVTVKILPSLKEKPENPLAWSVTTYSKKLYPPPKGILDVTINPDGTFHVKGEKVYGTNLETVLRTLLPQHEYSVDISSQTGISVELLRSFKVIAVQAGMRVGYMDDAQWKSLNQDL